MRARLIFGVAAPLLLLGAAPADERRALRKAEAAAAVADARAARLERRADAEPDEDRRGAAREAAIAARIAAAEAATAAAEVRVAITVARLAEQRARLAERQAPLQRLVAALQSLARRPAAAAVAQPGTIDDAVHVRALLGAMLPVIRARTAEMRAELERVRESRRNASLAVAGLRDGRARLQAEHFALVRLEGENRLRGGGSARFESDRAIALGERARDFAAQMRSTAAAEDQRETLAALPGPLPRPDAARAPVSPRFVVPPYRLPAAGRVVEGLGELSPTGVRARGLTLATAAAAPVVAPARGRVMFARSFRGYAGVVIIDHGAGWSSALTGLGGIAVRAGDVVSAGDLVGRATTGEPRVAVELRRRGVAVDLAQLLS